MARKGMALGTGRGYKNIVGRDPAVHSASAKGMKQPQRVPNIIPSKKDSSVSLRSHNYSMDLDGNKMKLTLGNLSDAGWFWDGTQDDFVGFLMRLNSSTEKGKFLRELDEEKVSYNRLKPFLIHSSEKADGLYEISGDNARWKFGEGREEDIDEFLSSDDITLTPEQETKFERNYDYDADTSFESFEKEFKSEYSKQIKEIANESKSVEDVFDRLDSLKEDWTEKVFEWEGNKQSDNFYKNWGKFKKEEKI